VRDRYAFSHPSRPQSLTLDDFRRNLIKRHTDKWRSAVRTIPQQTILIDGFDT
jgi:hypothetical protein